MCIMHTVTQQINFIYAKVHATAARARIPVNIRMHKLYIARKIESLTYVFAADSIGLSLFIFTYLFSKAKENKF